jgi:hypothetical protein
VGGDFPSTYPQPSCRLKGALFYLQIHNESTLIFEISCLKSLTHSATAANNVVKTVSTAANNVVKTVAPVVTYAANTVSTAANNVVKTVAPVVTSAVNTVTTAAQNTWNAVTSWF